MWYARKNGMRRLQKVDGSWSNVPSEMERMAQSYFQKVYTKEPTLLADDVLEPIVPQLAAAVNERLNAPFSDEEISDALFPIGPLKALGPDGFPSRFYKRNWSCLKVKIP